MADNRKTIAGVLPVFQTPFNDDETIDAQTLEREIDWLYECGVDGIVMAMVSEILRLSTDERMRLAELACKFNKNRGVVIISVGAESSSVAEQFASHAQKIGANAVMAIPPVSVALLEDQLLNYYRRIIRSIELPVIIQDASGYVGRPLSIELQSRLFDEFGSERVMFKPEATPIGPRLSALRDATDGHAKIFEGTGGLALVDSYRRGIAGTMPGADLIRGIVALWKALNAGDEQRIYALSTPIAALCSIQNSLDAFLAIEKYLLVRQGIFRNTRIRGPVGYLLDEETRREVDRLFDLILNLVS
ncbi:MAG TPA: dihydrodipicolinate synthase family protein [Tepidisphaeraceae bacterium]|nr:dihydrodipicolinate synthase family protein [Tepidisphaeraceae bacterium]